MLQLIVDSRSTLAIIRLIKSFFNFAIFFCLVKFLIALTLFSLYLKLFLEKLAGLAAIVLNGYHVPSYYPPFSLDVCAVNSETDRYRRRASNSE